MSALLLAVGLALSPADTLRLGELQRAAVREDPRASQLEMRREAAELRLRGIAVEGLPQLVAGAQATHQSEVPGIPIRLPGVTVPTPPKDRYEATLGVEQRLYDPTRGGRGALERARLEVERAELEATLHPLRAEVSDAFFTAFLLQERRAELGAVAEELEARAAVARAAVREGAALPGDTAVLRAELLRLEQESAEVEAQRDAALAVLGRLTGRAIGAEEVLALPELGAAVAAAGEGTRAHPQYTVLAARRAELDRQRALVTARTRPQLSAFGELGYGRPGPRQFTTDPHEYWQAGVRMRWVPGSWGTPARERALLDVQRRIVESEEAALAARLGRQLQDELRAMERLRATLATDDHIVALRGQVERQARAQLDERAISPADYVATVSRLQEARLARQRHRVELARAQASYLTTLGVALP